MLALFCLPRSEPTLTPELITALSLFFGTAGGLVTALLTMPTKREVQTLRTLCDDLSDAYEESQEERKAMRTEVATLRTENAEQRKAMRAIHGENQKLQRRVQGLQERIQELETENDTLRGIIKRHNLDERDG